MDLQQKIEEIKEQIKIIETRIEIDKSDLKRLKKMGRTFQKLMDKAKELEK